MIDDFLVEFQIAALHVMNLMETDSVGFHRRFYRYGGSFIFLSFSSRRNQTNPTFKVKFKVAKKKTLRDYTYVKRIIAPVKQRIYTECSLFVQIVDSSIIRAIAVSSFRSQ
jgi:hypothetical protein